MPGWYSAYCDKQESHNVSQPFLRIVLGLGSIHWTLKYIWSHVSFLPCPSPALKTECCCHGTVIPPCPRLVVLALEWVLLI